MNVVITLPKELIDAIIDGRKIFEMRKTVPLHLRLSEDGFFCVEKGTKNVRCWCRVDAFYDREYPVKYGSHLPEYLAVSREWMDEYMKGKTVKLWSIGQVVTFEKPLLIDKDLFVDRAPQSFAYTPLSYGRSY